MSADDELLSTIHAITNQPRSKGQAKHSVTNGYKQVQQRTLSGDLVRTHFSVTDAAKAAGLSPSTFRRKIREGMDTFKGFKWVEL